MNNKKIKIMILTYVWPPFAAVGAYRIIKFCKYLGDFGIEPVIFTPKNPNTMSKDESLRDMVPEEIRVYHSYSLEPFRWRGEKESPGKKSGGGSKSTAAGSSSAPQAPSLLSKIKKTIRMHMTVPDNQYFWTWSGLAKGISAAKNENIDLILSSSPPQSIHILGSRIARAVGKPHLTDFRDLWTQNARVEENRLPEHLERRNRNLEKRILKGAAAITVNTNAFKRKLLEKNSFLNDEIVQVVTNGVDPDDFNAISRRELSNDKFTMVYTGSLYRQRSPEFFFEALQKWVENRPEIRDRVRAVFIGNWSPEHADLPNKYDLDGIIDRRGWLPQAEALKATFDADLLLLFQGFDDSLAAAVPRKLGEYMITNNPLMVFALPGEITRLVEKYQCGAAFCKPDPDPIVSFLDRTFNEWNENREWTDPGLRSMPDFETYGQVKKLAEICQRIAK